MPAALVAPEPLAADVGGRILREGGSAVDAAVACAFAQGVVNPFLCGLGGSALVLHVDLSSGRANVIDGEAAVGSREVPRRWAEDYVGRAETFGRHAIASEENQIGATSVMVPGFVDAMSALLSSFGSGTFTAADLLKDATDLAADGFTVYPYIAQFWALGAAGDSHSARPAYPSLAEKMRREPRSARRYLRPDGTAYATGERFVQPWIADVLRHLQSRGLGDFLHGELGDLLSTALERDGALVTRGDVREYRAAPAPAMSHSIGGFTLHSTPPPSPGLQVLQMLAISRELGIDARDTKSGQTVDSVLRTARVMRASFADNRYIKSTRPAAAEDVSQSVLNPEAIRSWAERISSGDPVIVSGAAPGDGTTHVTAVDENHAVCITHSLGSAAGSGYAVPELGYLLNNFLGHYDPRPDRPDSIRAGARIGTGAPIVAVDDRGEFRMALGAPGGSRLISADFQVSRSILFGDYEADEAVALPRVHSEHGRTVFVEPGMDAGLVTALEEQGEQVVESTYMSRVQAISRDGDNALHAGSDPRGGEGVARRG
jgi:gamma-glutamyltranspeptidase/glutathione hydrolase